MDVLQEVNGLDDDIENVTKTRSDKGLLFCSVYTKKILKKQNLNTIKKDERGMFVLNVEI